MAEDEQRKAVTLRLAQLLAAQALTAKDQDIGERSLRRLSDPLRLMIFGLDSRYAASLLNLMLGERLVPQPDTRALIQVMYSDEVFADVHFRDGSRTKLPYEGFGQIFENNPIKIRIGAALPVLKKLSVMVVANSNADLLCEDIERAMFLSDIVLWTGADLAEPMCALWDRVPDELRSHSHVVRAPIGSDAGIWETIEADFVGNLTVDPEAALSAKASADGVDKAAFKAAGGVSLVKLIKGEIEVLTQSSLDAAEVLLMRHGEVGDTVKPERPESLAVKAEPDPQPLAVQPEPEPQRPPAEPSPATESVQKSEAPVAPRQVVASRPVSTIASRPRSVASSRVVSHSAPQAVNTPQDSGAKVEPKRVKTSRAKTGPAVTPWSLGL
ncbi:MAG: hypothetical protein QNJ20_10410 [Paracoccaceae bacterium]|nr:hypothetical protein [Paracoccaceae bacterium]